jgi:hypothetical protein
VASGEVYPNNPLRAGPLLIHNSDYGLSVAIEALDESGAVVGRTNQVLDFDESTTSGTGIAVFDVNDGASHVASVAIEVAARDLKGDLPRLLPPEPSVLVTVDDPAGGSVRQDVRRGGTARLTQGWSLRVTDVGYYARLSVVRDWSVPWIYGVLVVAILGLMQAVLTPYRAVWFRVDSCGSGSSVRMAVFAPRADPGFRSRVIETFAGRGISVETETIEAEREASL